MSADVRDAVTVPAMRAAIAHGRKPTLIFKMNVEVQEEKRAEENRGRYSIIPARGDELVSEEP